MTPYTPAARRLTATGVMFLETVEQSGGPTTASAVLVRLGDRYAPHAARQRRTRQARNELRWLSDAGLLVRVWVGPDAQGRYEYQLTAAGQALLARARTRDPGPHTNTSPDNLPVVPGAVEPPAATEGTP